ncbi:hypothetical protein BKA62DRAFT_463975 [Auriculariales sp. MPI-PUGE-AT-0066]|nr:hypothetical protein BKA62DRAFT_463975 [Auriculariales sp. MPI-PUGE-AT-0066]
MADRPSSQSHSRSASGRPQQNETPANPSGSTQPTATNPRASQNSLTLSSTRHASAHSSVVTDGHHHSSVTTTHKGGVNGSQTDATASPTATPASFSSGSPSTTTIIAASVGATAAVLLLVGLLLLRRCRRKRNAAPPPARFTPWVNDRATRAHTVYDMSEVDPYATSPAYDLNPSGSSSKASPASDAPTTFLPLPVHGRSSTGNTDSWISSRSPSIAGSSFPLIPPLSSSSSGVSPVDSSFDQIPPVAPFAQSHRSSSRQSFSSNHDSRETSPAPTPPPMEPGMAPLSSATSIRSSRYAQSQARRSMVRPVSVAGSVQGQRNSIYSVAVSTIRGAPHQAHNRVDIVLPAPLDPASYVPAAPFMTGHSRTGSDRSRYSMSTPPRGPAWRDHSPSPSREGSVNGNREDDAASVRSHRSLSQRSITGMGQERTVSNDHLPPVPPLPASMSDRRPSSPKSSLRSQSPAQSISRRGPSSLVQGDSADVVQTSASSMAPALERQMPLEELTAAAVNTLFQDMAQDRK